MADGVETATETPTVSSETQALAELGRKGAVEHRDPLAPQLSETPRPAHIPEKFWDPINGTVRVDELAKSYTHLESMKGQKVEEETTEETTEETEEVTTEETTEETTEVTDEETEESTEETEEETPPAPSEALTSAIEVAQAAYAETGEVTAEAREALNAQGISNDYIDRYIAGVKAQEAALWGAAEDVAGDADTLQAAREWAAENWSEKKIASFDAMSVDLETVREATTMLMNDYRKANPGEGKLTDKTTGMVTGEVYKSMDEFHADLRKADETRDAKARKAAVDKLRRSKAAKTIKSAPRRQPFGN